MNSQHKYIDKLIIRNPELGTMAADIEEAVNLMYRCYLGDSTIFTCGNGGSASDSEHIVGELMKGFALKRELPVSKRKVILDLYPDQGDEICANLQQGIPAVSLVSSSALMTAILNDLDPAYIFAQQIYAIGRKGDVLIAISTSGNSANVVNAAKVALAKGMSVISLTGQTGGVLTKFSTVTLKAPSSNVGYIQEYHLPIYHCLCLVLEDLCFGEDSLR
jgi:D-sedoheptulose 7-phosphate isomerase